MLMYLVVPGEAISCTGEVAASSAGGGEGVLSFSPLFLRAFLRRCKQKRMRERMAMSPTRPPTTPPAIAPTLVLLEFPVPEGLAVPVGTVRVAALAENVGTRVK